MVSLCVHLPTPQSNSGPVLPRLRCGRLPLLHRLRPPWRVHTASTHWQLLRDQRPAWRPDPAPTGARMPRASLRDRRLPCLWRCVSGPRRPPAPPCARAPCVNPVPARPRPPPASWRSCWPTGSCGSCSVPPTCTTCPCFTSFPGAWGPLPSLLTRTATCTWRDTTSQVCVCVCVRASGFEFVPPGAREVWACRRLAPPCVYSPCRGHWARGVRACPCVASPACFCVLASCLCGCGASTPPFPCLCSHSCSLPAVWCVVDASDSGLVSVINPAGALVRDIEIPKAEVSGLALTYAPPHPPLLPLPSLASVMYVCCREDGLIVTEASSNSVYVVPL